MSFLLIMMGFRGTNVEQDGRWGKADERLMKKMANAGKFSAILNEKIDMSKVDLDTIGKWCKERLFEILGFEDDIVLGLLMNLLQHSNFATTVTTSNCTVTYYH